jgi:hypothetical protein
MTTPEGFEATFRVGIDRDLAWRRLAEDGADPDGRHLWLPGFDTRATVEESDPSRRLRATKDDEPCAGTDIVVTLTDAEGADGGTGTRIHVVQSRFGDWLADHYDVMAVGWRHIVADLQTYLATGVHARRHLRPWGDLGAAVEAADGGIAVGPVRPGGLADRLGLEPGDLLVTLGGAPTSSLDDLLTVLRVVEAVPQPQAEWVRDGRLVTAPVTAPD